MKIDISKLVNVKKQADGSIQCQCPICLTEGKDRTNKNHLKIYKTGAFNCIAYNNDRQHNSAIKRFLCGTQPEENPDIVYIDPEPKVNIPKIYPEETLKSLVPDYNYWLKRGAKEEVVKLLEGGLSPEHEKNKLSNRFVFPIRGLDGKINGFTGRLVTDNSFAPRWKHVFKSGQAVWPHNVSSKYISETKSVVLVESVGDTIALMSNDIWNVICIFGLNINSKIASFLLANDVKKIIISLNNDDDESKGQKAANKIKSRLSNFFLPEHIIIRLPQTGKDWGCAKQEEIQLFKQEISQ